MFNIAPLRDLDVRQQDLFENQRRGGRGEFGSVFLTAKDPKPWTRFDGEESSKESAVISEVSLNMYTYISINVYACYLSSY